MTHNTQPVTKEELVEEFKEQMTWYDLPSTRLEEIVTLYGEGLDRYGTEQRAEGAEELATIMRDGGCVCGENRTVGVVHRKYAPCYWPAPTDTPLPDNKD